MSSSFLTQNQSSQSCSGNTSSLQGSYLTNKNTASSNDTPQHFQSKDQYQEYVQKKRGEKNRQQNQEKLSDQFQICRKIVYALFIAFFVFVFYSLTTQKSNSAHQNNQKPQDHAFPNPRPKAAPTSGTCNSYLPYSISTQKDLQRSYYLWYGKVGNYINGMSYETGHFIQRHVAFNGQCTYSQSAQGKTVFYDWSQVTKAFRKTSVQKCSLSDQNTFSYDFQFRIASPSQYIKGIDCRTGIIRNFPKFFILYRRAIKNPNPYQYQYLASNQITIWTFYPKN